MIEPLTIDRIIAKFNKLFQKPICQGLLVVMRCLPHTHNLIKVGDAQAGPMPSTLNPEV